MGAIFFVSAVLWYVAVGVVSCLVCEATDIRSRILLVALWPFLYVGTVIYVVVDGLTKWR